MRKYFITILALSVSLSAQSQSGQFEKKVLISQTDTLHYRMLYPTGYDGSKKYPLLLFLHGAGERGNDNESQLKHGARLFSDALTMKNYPAIVVFPQCEKDDFWSRISRNTGGNDSLGGFSFPVNQPAGRSASLVLNLLDTLVQSGIVNTHRIYLGGLSMGAMGTFEFLWRRPRFFAAAFAICGGGNPETVSQYARDFPIWIFHGDKDPVVPVSNSRLMYEVLKSSGAQVIYTEYPGVNHNSWDPAFAETGLLKWLFSHELKN